MPAEFRLRFSGYRHPNRWHAKILSKASLTPFVFRIFYVFHPRKTVPVRALSNGLR